MARTFGENLRRLRREKQITQEALMQRIGLKRQTPISLWETEGILPKPQTIEKIARALGCKTSELLEDVVTPYDLLRQNRSVSDDARARGPTGRRAVRNVRASSA